MLKNETQNKYPVLHKGILRRYCLLEWIKWDLCPNRQERVQSAVRPVVTHEIADDIKRATLFPQDLLHRGILFRISYSCGILFRISYIGEEVSMADCYVEQLA